MKTKSSKKALRFGDLVASFYHTYGKRKGKGLLQLLVKADLVRIQGRTTMLQAGKMKKYDTESIHSRPV